MWLAQNYNNFHPNTEVYYFFKCNKIKFLFVDLFFYVTERNNFFNQINEIYVF